MSKNKNSNIQDSLKPIVALAKRRGFIYPGSEIYGGFANTYSFGPYGAELKKNIKDHWWKSMVQMHENIVGIDSAIFMHPTIWKASGHVDNFNDPMIDNKDSKKRYRVDHLIEGKIEADVSVKIAISRITWITFFRAPDLLAGIAVARKRGGPCQRVIRRVNRRVRLRIAEYQTVGIEDKPTQVRFLQHRVHSWNVGTLRQPKS